MSWVRGLGWWRRRKAEANERRMASIYGGANTFHAHGRFLEWGWDRAAPAYTPEPDDQKEVAEVRAKMKDRITLIFSLPPHTKIHHHGGRRYLVELCDGPDPAEQGGLESIDRLIAPRGGSVIHVADVAMESV